MILERLNWARALRCSLIVSALIGLTPFVSADSDYARARGPDVGTIAPMLSALDQHGKQQDLGTLKGSNGLLFVFNRSVDW